MLIYWVKLHNRTGKLDMTVKNGTIIKEAVFRRPKLVLVISSILVLLFASASYGAFFDTAGQTARPMGMGEVFLAQKGDASGYWYNPAGLSNVQGRKVGISYGVINPSISSDLMKYQITYVNPLGETSGFGLGISGLGADGASEMVISGAYGTKLGEKFALGGNIKVLRWAIDGQKDPYSGKTDDDLSKVSFSLDLSGSYALGELFGLADFTTGVFVKDAIMPNISESGDDGGKLPVEVGLGLMAERGLLLGEVDLAFVDGQTVFHAGVESGLTGTDLKFRGGLIYGSDFEDDVERTDFDFGLGYTFNSLVFDYAYNLPLELTNSGGRHFVSFGVSF